MSDAILEATIIIGDEMETVEFNGEVEEDNHPEFNDYDMKLYYNDSDLEDAIIEKFGKVEYEIYEVEFLRYE